jgi:hypothetical protein
MSIPVALRPDYDDVRLRQLACSSKDAPQTRRLLAPAVIYEGGSRTQRPRSAELACRPCVTGFCASMPVDPMGSWMARRQASPRP